MSFFYNAVSFISGLFFTKQAEQDFDDLYLNEDDPIGNLAPLVPSKVEPPAEPPAEPPGVFLVVVPPAEPSGVVLVEIPPAELPAEPPAVTLDLLKLKQNSTTPIKESNPANDAEIINYADATKPYVLPSWVTKSKSSITSTKRKYYEDISEIEFCVEIVDDYDSEASYDYTLETNILDDFGGNIKLGFINLLNFKVKIEPNNFVNYVNYVGTKLLIPVNITEKTINIINRTNGVDTNDVLVQRLDNENSDLDDDSLSVNIVEKMVQAVQQLNKCINNQDTFQIITDTDGSFETLFFGQTQDDINNITPRSSFDNNSYLTYFNANMKSKSKDIISQKLTLVMTYKKLYKADNIDDLTLETYDKYDDYTISFSYAITAEKTQKKTLMTQTMVDFIALKLTTGAYNNCVKQLFVLPPVLPDTKYVLLEPEGATNSDRTTLQIYTPNELDTITDWSNFRTKLADLQNKPRTLLAHDSLNTYLNILIAMLDKPHDIIGGRVSEEAQKNVLKIISENIEKYINYVSVIKPNFITKINGIDFNNATKTDKIAKFTDFIKFVKSMIPKFKQSTPSKYINSDVIYENAIMLSVQQILKEAPGVTSGTFVTDLNYKFPLPPAVMGNDNVVINPDVMYLTTEITSRVNQNQPNATIRKYFSAPEVIDHGHIYNINNNTNIQFPENYKQIQLRDPWKTTIDYFTIHSYSETTNEPPDSTSTSINTLYYNVYVWFTENADPIPKGIIKYKTPFIYAPDCARVYAGYKNIISDKSDETGYEVIKDAFNTIAANFTTLSDDMRELIPYLMIDQFYNAKSLQDDQNQLQVNQRTTIPPTPVPVPVPVPVPEIPTQFLGLCCDLTSAANGFNYYMSRPAAERNPESIVGYYHSNKKIWVTNGNEIKVQINAPAKTASKNILDILQTMIDNFPPLGGPVVVGGDVNGGDKKRSRDETESRDWTENKDWLESRADVQSESKRIRLMTPDNKRKRENAEKINPPGIKLDFEMEEDTTDQVEGRGVIENLNQKEKAKEEANAITLSYYCHEANWLNDDTKTEEYGQYVYYNTMADWLYLDDNFETYKNLLFKQVRYVMTGTKYAVPGTEYLSSNYFFDILSIDFIEKMIKMLENSKPLITEMIENNEPDILEKIIAQCAIYILTKIELKPDNIYPPDEQIKKSNQSDTNFNEIKNEITKFITMEELGGGFSKKKIFRKNTNKKRTIRKKTNKKRTIRKKIRHTIFKTKKNHK